MNLQFRDYVFGTAFTLHLRENQINALAELCKDGAHGFIFDQRHAGALLSRGLIAHVLDEESGTDGRRFRYRPTRAGLLVYDLLVEAGHSKQLEAQRRAIIDAEHKLDQEEWDKRHADIASRIRLKDGITL